MTSWLGEQAICTCTSTTREKGPPPAGVPRVDDVGARGAVRRLFENNRQRRDKGEGEPRNLKIHRERLRG